MIVQLYALWDRIAQEFGPVFTAKNDGVAVRAARIAIKGAREDEHQLVMLGTLDTERWNGLVAEEKGRQIEIPEVVGEHIRSDQGA